MSDIPEVFHVVLTAAAKPSKGAYACYSAFESERYAREFAEDLGYVYIGSFKKERLTDLELHQMHARKLKGK